MVQERISMRKTKEILRLKYEKMLSNRQISISTGVSRDTVARYFERATTAGIDWEKDRECSEEELEEKLFFQKELKSYQKRARLHEPDWQYVHDELKRPNVTLALLWEEYRGKDTNGYQYSYFSELYLIWKKKQRLSMRQAHKAGEKVFVDYGDGLRIVDRSTGEEVDVDLFVAVWGASNYTYAEASMTQTKRDWVMSHVRAFEYFGCTPQIVVPDNLKSGVTRACRYEPEVNRSYLDVAQHYGCVVVPARPYRPKDKAKAEVGVLIAKRWIVASLRNRTFFSLEELNAAIRELLEKLNNRLMKKQQKSRREVFEELDRPAAQVLPESRYEYSEWKKCRVSIDYHVEIDVHYYSVPYQLLSEEVDARFTDQYVEIFYKGKRQASHVRSFEKHHHTTIKAHMPVSHQRHSEWNPSRILSWAEKIGPNTGMMVKAILESRKHPEIGYRSCLGILQLSKRYSAERMENACKRAIAYRNYSFKSIRLILDNGLDKQADGIAESCKPGPMHENVRGSLYYKDDGALIH
jgi:transposase